MTDKRLQPQFTFDPSQSGLETILGELESAIMRLVWKHSPVTAREVLTALSQQRKLAYTTVMTVMTRLTAKGLLSKEKSDSAYVFRPIYNREAFEDMVVKRTLESLAVAFPNAAGQKPALATASSSSDSGFTEVPWSALENDRLRTLTGDDILLGDPAGQRRLLCFWARWSQASMAALKRFNQYYRDHPGQLTFLAVANQSGSEDQIRTLAREHEISVPLARGSDRLADRLLITVFPALISIDPMSQSALCHHGSIDDEAVSQWLRSDSTGKDGG